MTRVPGRRDFLKAAVGAVVSTAVGTRLGRSASERRKTAVPSYLRGYESPYAEDPRKAARAWFADAKFGLFMHYGLYSLLGRGEWVMLREKIPVAEYEKLRERFTAARFDADFITDLALEAGMRYVNITSRHHDGFCLFETAQHDYHSMAAAAKRDLIGELAEACAKKGLGLFLYYSYAADWWHPYFYAREAGWPNARPAYDKPEPRYKWRKDEDFQIYIDYVHAQLRELLSHYGPIAGIWFDPIMGYYHRPDLFPIEQTYELVRSLQPQVLISFKQGATGTEDFAAPERSGHSLASRLKDPRHRQIAQRAWRRNKNKHNEICDTLQPRVWGYRKADDSNHLGAAEVLRRLERAWGQGCNLLLNTGPLPDGSIHPVDVETLRQVGRQLRARRKGREV